MFKKITAIIAVFFYLSAAQAQNELAPGLDIIGYGYNVFGKFADNESKMPYQLFDLGADRVVPIGAMRYDVPQNVILENIGKKQKTEISGSNQREYAKSFGMSVGLEVDAMLFGASVSNAFEKSWGGAERQYFHTIRDANRTWRISMDKRTDLKTILDPDFAGDLNNPNFDPLQLFETYGTHFIASAYLGGRADFTSVTKITEKFTKEEVSASVGATYSGITAEVGTSAAKENKDIKENTNWELTVTGGNSEFANDIRNYQAYSKWAEGIRTLPVLCDFEKGSLIPIWELTTGARKAQLQAAFDQLCRENPIPEAMADVTVIKNDVYMVKCVSGGLYWDFGGFNTKAETKGGKLKIYPKDGGSNKGQGFDRVYKIIPDEMDPQYVYIQPQHTDLVLEIAAESKTAAAEVILSDYKKNNAAQLFKMLPVDGQNNVYYLINKNSGLYLEIPTGKEAVNNSVVVQNNKTEADNQKWMFEAFDPQNIAQPADAYYTIYLPAAKKYWDFPGSYPEVKANKLQLWAPGAAIGDRTYKIAKVNDYYVIRPDHHPSNLLTAKKNVQLSTEKQTRADNQLFRFEYGGQPNTYLIVNKETNQVIDASAKNILTDGCTIGMANKTGAENQRWQLMPYTRKTPLYEGTFNIKVASTNKYLDLSGNDQVSNKNGANAQIWDMDGGKDRLLKFIPTSNPTYYKIQFQNGGKMLDVGGYWKLTDMSIPDQGLYRAGKSDKKLKKDKGANIQAWDDNGKDNQLWRIVPLANNNFAIINKHSGKALDVVGSDLNKNGANLQQYNWENSDQSQQWKIINTSNKAELGK